MRERLSGSSMMVPSAPLISVENQFFVKGSITYDGQRAYGRESGPCRAGIGRGGDLAQLIQPIQTSEPTEAPKMFPLPSLSTWDEAGDSSTCEPPLRKSSDSWFLLAMMTIESGEDGGEGVCGVSVAVERTRTRAGRRHSDDINGSRECCSDSKELSVGEVVRSLKRSGLETRRGVFA